MINYYYLRYSSFINRTTMSTTAATTTTATTTTTAKVNLADLQKVVLAQRAVIEAELSLTRVPAATISAPKRLRASLSTATTTTTLRREPLPSSRKSMRLSELPRVDMREEALYRDLPRLVRDYDESGSGAGASAGAGAGAGASAGIGARLPPAPPSWRPPSEPSPTSSKSHFTRFDFLQKTFLGRFLPFQPSGSGGSGGAKKAAMETADRDGKLPAFNKYAGLQEWKDSMLFFVNLWDSKSEEDESGGGGGGGGAGSSRSGTDHRNLFTISKEKGAVLNWYGADRLHELSPQLLRARYSLTGWKLDSTDDTIIIPSPPSSSTDTIGSKPCKLGLMVRLASNLPYIYLGELIFDSLTKKSHPVEFFWRLKDYDSLIKRAKESLGDKPSTAAIAKAAQIPDIQNVLEESKVSSDWATSGSRLTTAPLPPPLTDRFISVLHAGGLSLKEIGEKCLK